MKSILTSILLLISTALFAAGNDLTNGVFYIDSPVECHLISQNGASLTNQLVAGKTYMVGEVLVELEPTNKTTFYFSGGPLIEASAQSSFTVSLFDQEVKNLDAQPRRAEFGSHSINLTFSKGEFSIIYPNADANSSLMVNTPYATYQLHGGKYFFRVSGKSVIAFVMDGIMTVHGDKNRKDKTEKGKLSVAIPFSDPASGVDDKIVTSIKQLKQEEVDRFSAPCLNAEKKWGNVLFVVINGRVIGVLVKAN
jgi:hypothetical protein